MSLQKQSELSHVYLCVSHVQKTTEGRCPMDQVNSYGFSRNFNESRKYYKYSVTFILFCLFCDREKEVK